MGAGQFIPIPDNNYFTFFSGTPRSSKIKAAWTQFN
jgi:hypothetical protein